MEQGGLNDGSVRSRVRLPEDMATMPDSEHEEEAAGGDGHDRRSARHIIENVRRCETTGKKGFSGNLERTPERRSRHCEAQPYDRDLVHRIAELFNEDCNNLHTRERQPARTNQMVEEMGRRRGLNATLHRTVRPSRLEFEYPDLPQRRVADREYRVRPNAGNHNQRHAGNVQYLQQQRTKVPQYDGTSSWTDYLVQFELVAELNGWDDNLMAMQLATNLRGAAQSVLGDLDDYGRRDNDSLVAILNQRFGPDNQTEMFRALLRNRTRGPHETLPELAHEIRRLVKLAYPTGQFGILEDLAKNHFVDAIQEADSRWHIQQSQPRNLDEAVRVAGELEAFQQAEKHRGTGKKSVRVVKAAETEKNDNNQEQRLKQTEEMLTKVKDMVESSVQAFKTLEERLENVQKKGNFAATRHENSRRQNWRPLECYHCGQPGHKRPDCPQLRRRNDRNKLGN